MKREGPAPVQLARLDRGGWGRGRALPRGWEKLEEALKTGDRAGRGSVGVRRVGNYIPLSLPIRTALMAPS